MNDTSTQWFGARDDSALARLLGDADTPVGDSCAACTQPIQAEDAGIVGTSLRKTGGFKASTTRFVLHAGCISGAPRQIVNTTPRATVTPETIEIPRKYRDWDKQHFGERPPYPKSDLDALKQLRETLRAEHVALSNGSNASRVTDFTPRDLRRFQVETALLELGSELAAAEGAYANGTRNYLAMEETVAIRIRNKAMVLTLEDMLPGFSDKYGQRFDELYDRDYKPLLHSAMHASWATRDSYADWTRTVGTPLYGIPDERSED